MGFFAWGSVEEARCDNVVWHLGFELIWFLRVAWSGLEVGFGGALAMNTGELNFAPSMYVSGLNHVLKLQRFWNSLCIRFSSGCS